MNFPDSEARLGFAIRHETRQDQNFENGISRKSGNKKHAVSVEPSPADLVSMPASFPTRKRCTVGKAGVSSAASVKPHLRR